MKKRELLLLGVLFIAAYAFVFVKFVWGSSLPKIESVKESISVAQQEKAKLDEDLTNIDKLKNSLGIKNIQNERISEYLMDDASSADSIDYLDKLGKTFEKSIQNVSFSVPVKKEAVVEGAKDGEAEKGDIDNIYYEFRFSFKAAMAYDDIMDIVDFIEGGSRKVKISKFNITPSVGNTSIAPQVTDEDEEEEIQNSGTNSSLFNLDMEVNMYSKNLGSINDIYNYVNNNYHRFNTNEGEVIIPTNAQGVGAPDGVVNVSPSGTSASTGTKKDIDIRLEGFLKAGPNFWIFGAGGYNNNFARFKTKKGTLVEINIEKETYKIRVNSDENGTYNLEGALQGGEPYIAILAAFPLDVPENQDLGVEVKVTNNSGETVNISLKDRNNRVQITDRNGAVIHGHNQNENVKIL